MRKLSLCLGLLLISFACTPHKNVSEKKWKEAEQDYRAAVQRVTDDPASLYLNSGLFALNPDKTDEEGYLTLMAWKGAESAEKYYNAPGELDTLDSKFLTWVFAEREFKSRSRTDRLWRYRDVALALRLDQLLGLPPEKGDTSRVFITFKIKAADLFRPCPDPEINDCTCVRDSIAGAYSLPFSDGYRKVFDGLIKSQAGWPWTRLGYTFDWKRDIGPNVGMSEFIIRQGAVVKIVSKIPTEQWLSENKQKAYY